ncbi:MAG: hypothetical protein WA151_16620 [Desulfatirhabdiaceae bacterium]
MASALILKNVTIGEVRNRLEKIRTIGRQWGGSGFVKPSVKEVEMRTTHQTDSECTIEILFKGTRKSMSISQWAFNVLLLANFVQNGTDVQVNYYTKRAANFGCMGCCMGCLDPAFLFSMFLGGNVENVRSKFNGFLATEFKIGLQ